MDVQLCSVFTRGILRILSLNSTVSLSTASDAAYHICHIYAKRINRFSNIVCVKCCLKPGECIFCLCPLLFNLNAEKHIVFAAHFNAKLGIKSCIVFFIAP